MKQESLETTIAATVRIVLAGSANAGNNPNTARAMTGGIGSGATHGRIPSSHPGTKCRASGYRNSYAIGCTGKYRGGLGPGRSSAVSSAATSSSCSDRRPASVPGADRWSEHAETKARSRIPASLPLAGSGNPGSGGNATAGIPSSVSTGTPSSVSTGMPGLPPSLPDAASAGRVPISIPPVSTGGGMSASIPAMPDATSTRIPDAAAAGLAKRGKGRP